MRTAATPTNALSGRRRLNPISNEIPFSKWRKRGWRRLYMQTVNHAVAGATLAEHVPMHPDRARPARRSAAIATVFDVGYFSHSDVGARRLGVGRYSAAGHIELARRDIRWG
jgi:hypothetical protein